MTEATTSNPQVCPFELYVALRHCDLTFRPSDTDTVILPSDLLTSSTGLKTSTILPKIPKRPPNPPQVSSAQFELPLRFG